MKATPLDPERLRDHPLSDGEQETDGERAARLLRAIGDPQVPSRQALLEAKPEFSSFDRRRVHARPVWKVVGAVVVVVMLSGGAFAAGRAMWMHERRPVVVEVPAGSTSRLAGSGGAKIQLNGPSALVLGSRSMTLRSGDALVEAGNESVSLDIGDLGVTVAPGGAARTSAEGENTRVENVRGEVVLKHASNRQSSIILPGQSWYRGVVAASLPEPAPASPPPLEIAPQMTDALSAAPAGVGLPEPQHPRDRGESHLLGAALKKLRKESNPKGALDLFDQYDRAFPRGTLAPEALVGRVEALMALGRKGDALAILDGPLTQWKTSRALRVLRGELRAAAGRCEEASADFAAVLSAEPHDAVDERALFGRAFCRSRGGDKTGARQDLSLYATTFPNGQFIGQVRRSLDGG
jgi:hypothetical protein